MTQSQAIKILGKDQVLTPEMAAKLFGKNQNLALPFTEKELKEAAKENKAGEDWCLIYASPLSFLEQREIIGTGKDKFYNYSWWLTEAWAKEKPIEGWYLINFNLKFNHTNWDGQNKKIELGCERADERVVSQAVFGFLNTKKLLENSYHWGRILDSRGYRVCVRLLPGGLHVFSVDPSYSDNDFLFVCGARKSLGTGSLDSSGSLEARILELEKFKEKVEGMLKI